MEIEVIAYKVKSDAGLPIQYYVLSKEDEDAYIEQLKYIKSLNAYDIKEIAVKVWEGAVLDFNKNVVVYPRLGVKTHVSQVVNDKRFGTVQREKPLDIDYWLEL